jgi:hypothetical protein
MTKAPPPQHHYGKVVVSSALERLESIAVEIESLPLRWPILFFVILYGAVAVATAKTKLLWDDEFFTLYISRAGSMTQIMEALATGADQHPPLFYYLTHLFTVVFGTSHLTVRLLPICGFGMMCVCLFYILYRRTSLLWALLGMTLPLASSAFYYATEARGYGSELGFCALALLAWQRVTSSSTNRPKWLVVLFFACGLAVSSHYYAVLFIFALGLGEGARSIQLKRIDIWTWLSLMGGAVPLLIFFGTIRKASGYSAHFWAVPIWGTLMDYYLQLFGGLANILVVGAVPYLVILLRSEAREEDYRLEIRRFSTYEVVAWSSIAAIPLFTMILAKTVTHGYIERYAISAMVGAVVLLCHFGYAVAPRPRSFALILCTVGLLYFTAHSIWLIRISRLDVKTLSEHMAILESHTSSPFVMADITKFHQSSFYAPRNQLQNVAYVADPQASVEYIFKDTVDRGLLDLRPWFPINVVPRQQFVAEHHEFLVYSYLGSWTWLTYVLLPPHYQTELLDRVDANVLLSAHLIDRTSAINSISTRSFSDALFNRMSKDGPSLCRQWMPDDGFCFTIEKQRQEAVEERRAGHSK